VDVVEGDQCASSNESQGLGPMSRLIWTRDGGIAARPIAFLSLTRNRDVMGFTGYAWLVLSTHKFQPYT
jgi:hypothetical protein